MRDAPQAIGVVEVGLAIALHGNGIIDAGPMGVAGKELIVSIIFEQDVLPVVDVAGDDPVYVLLDPPTKAVVAVGRDP